MKMAWSVRVAMVALALGLAASPSLATPPTMAFTAGSSVGVPQQNDSGQPIIPGTQGIGLSQFVSDATLSTIFASDNSFAGNTFDLVSNVDITIVGWDVNLSNGGATETMDVYWRLGTAVGNENSAAGWNLMGSDSGVVSQGVDTPTAVAVGGLTMTAGQVYGIYIDMSSYSGLTVVLYTNGGPTVFSNADLSLTTNDGRGNPAFTGSQFFPRQWNGTVFYNYVITAPTLPPWAAALMMTLLLAAAIYVLRTRGSNPLAG